VQHLDLARKQAAAVQDKIKLTQIMSLVSERLSAILLIERKLGGPGANWKQC
jgi:hypothetical protein